MTDIVICFHRPVAAMAQDDPHFEALLRVWAHSWRSMGWRPFVVDPFDVAKRHPLYHPFFNRCFSLPTCNPKDYEMGCWLRWLAFEVLVEELRQPLLEVDSDVLNYALSPFSEAMFPKGAPDVLLLDGNCNACAVYANRAGAAKIVSEAFAWNPPHEQASDMWFFGDFGKAHPEFVCKPPLCGEFQAHYPWQLPLVHFATGACGGRGEAKKAAIERYIDGLTGRNFRFS